MRGWCARCRRWKIVGNTTANKMQKRVLAFITSFDLPFLKSLTGFRLSFFECTVGELPRSIREWVLKCWSCSLVQLDDLTKLSELRADHWKTMRKWECFHHLLACALYLPLVGFRNHRRAIVYLWCWGLQNLCSLNDMRKLCCPIMELCDPVQVGITKLRCSVLFRWHVHLQRNRTAWGLFHRI